MLGKNSDYQWCKALDIQHKYIVLGGTVKRDSLVYTFTQVVHM